MKSDNFFDLFDMIYVINLEARADRKKEMEHEFSKFGLSFNSSKVTLFKAIKPEMADEFPSLGAKGCFLSHLEVLKDSIQKSYKKILIFEDDLNFVKNFNEKFIEVLNELENKNWDIFYGDYRLDNIDLKFENNHNFVYPSINIGTSNFMAFNGQVMKKIVEYFEAMMSRPGGDPLGGPMHVDGAYSWFRKDHKEFTTVLATPPLGYQRSSLSDIAPPSLKDNIPFANTFRVLMNKLR